MAMKLQIQFLLMCVCILATLTTKGAVGVSTSAPLNRVVYEGATNTTITCKNKESFMDWSIIPYPSVGSSSGKIFTRNGKIISPFNDSFAVDHVEGTDVHTLVIYNATISPSGRAKISTTGFYQCRTNGTFTAAQLVVVRNDPICSSDLTQSTVSCTIVYGGYREFPIDAVMNWSVNGQPIPSENAKFTINSTPTEITATSVLVVSQDSDATYECATKFSKTANNRYSDVANNAPDYYKTCTISISKPTTESATTSSTSTSTVASIYLAPLNRVLYEGATNTTMSCTSRGGAVMEWYFAPFSNTKSFGTNILVRNGEIKFPINESFAIDYSHGTEVNTIVIFNATIYPSERTTLSTAGDYQCFDRDTQSFFAHKLVVIRSDPICSSNFTQSTTKLQSDDVIQLSCTILYGSRRQHPIDAIMNWSVNGQPIPPTNSTFTINSSPTEITATSTLVVNANSDATYECATTFSHPDYDPYSGVSNKAPDYYKTCTISIEVGVDDMTTINAK